MDFIFVQRFLTQTRVQVLFACFKLRTCISSTVTEVIVTEVIVTEVTVTEVTVTEVTVTEVIVTEVTVTEVSSLTSLCSPSFNIRSQGLPILWTS